MCHVFSAIGASFGASQRLGFARRLVPSRRSAAAGVFAGITAIAAPAAAEVVDLGNVQAVTAGGSHACVVTGGGGAKCWGWNAQGQLGDGSIATRPTAVGVLGLASGVAAISAGEGHTCALTVAGGVKCWGSNEYGQLGIGQAADSKLPADVPGLSGGIAAITAGSYHTCALTKAGAVLCWGREGGVGNGTATSAPMPTLVTGLESGVAAIAAGGFHSYALTVAGKVYCWGMNVDGQLGDGTAIDRGWPTPALGLGDGVKAITAGAWHSCAVTSSGEVRCWGNNSFGQVGNGAAPSSRVATPVPVANVSGGIASLSAGYAHTCLVSSDGRTRCWGSNEAGQLGDGSTASQLAPVDVHGLAGVPSGVAAAQYHTCARVGGGVQCWGANDGYQLGDGTDGDRTAPAPVRVATHALVIAKSGVPEGRVTSSPPGIDCGGSCSMQVPSGDTVTLAAASPQGVFFTGWSGACAGRGACTVVLNGDESVGAGFVPYAGELAVRFRLYNPANLEHLYTTSAIEYAYLTNQIDRRCCGWSPEGPVYQVFRGEGTFAGVQALPYLRLYNPYSRQHHWTTDAFEYAYLGTVGWNQEGVDGYILPSPAQGTSALYRLYLEAAGGLHLWTTDLVEVNYLTTNAGWTFEGVAGYVIPLQ
jgi:alpha-tubulin suppressor-like RCC1 family protein